MLLQLVLLLPLVAYVLLNLYILRSRLQHRHMNCIPVPMSHVWFMGVLPDVKRRVKSNPLKGFVSMLLDYHYETEWDVFAIPVFTKNMIFCMDIDLV